jgi:high-affinity iron transporter
MVLWLGVWMHDRRHAAAWQDYIKSSLVGGGGRFGFAMLAFFSVYRELFEVILFYETLWLQAGPAGHNAVLAGATALVLLVGLAWVILRGSAKLPLALFFSINAALLCALSVVFAGHGVKALQEAGSSVRGRWRSSTSTGWASTPTLTRWARGGDLAIVVL